MNLLLFFYSISMTFNFYGLWFSNIKPTLHSYDKAHLVMMYFSHVLLDSMC